MSLPRHFQYRGQELHVEGVALSTIAERFGTPAYVYSKAALVEGYRRYADAIEACGESSDRASICYAVKANPNLSILRLFAGQGAGFDIVSGGELERVLKAGGDPARVIFSGVGKTRAEMTRALEVGIRCFNVESMSELAQLGDVARLADQRAAISLRINTDVDARTPPYIYTGLREKKLGIALADAMVAYRLAAAHPYLDVIGVDCHIGSQLLDAAPLLEALDKLIELIDALDREGIVLSHLDLGGGIGITYDAQEDGAGISIADYMTRVFERLRAWHSRRPDRVPLRVLFEPGRSLVGNAALLLSRVLVLKEGDVKNFAIVDAAMNDLLRPSLYNAWHDVVTVKESKSEEAPRWDVVGPICESGDWLAKDRALPLAEHDLIALMSAGAYAMSMASNYNSRPRAVEVLVDGSDAQVIRHREDISSLFANEVCLP